MQGLVSWLLGGLDGFTLGRDDAWRSDSGGCAVGRVKSVLVAGVVAVAVSTVAAGPAVAAKGGNSDNAHACQQGGHENRFEAETGRPFKNAGDCASHGAQGGASSSLLITPLPMYPCSTGTCWGTISGSGLNVNNQWMAFIVGPGLIVASGFPAPDGNLGPTQLDVPCDQGQEPLQAVAVTAGAQPSDITSKQVNSPCG
jgi:hypothetical protein